MATTLRKRDFRRSAEGLVTCSICTELYKEPKMLPCQHTFCLSCLEGFVESCNKNRILKVTNFLCPSCRKIHFIPSGGIQNFPTDFKVTQICDFLEQLDSQDADNAAQKETTENVVKEEETVIKESKKHTGDQCDICTYKDKQTEAKYFCTSCGKYLCEGCHHHHAENPVFDEHYTLLVDTASDASAILICKDHQEEVKYFCEDCETALCTVCALGIHGKHSLSDISTSLAKQRNLVASGLDALRNRLGQYELKAEEITNLKEQYTSSYAKAKETIKSQAQILKESLEKQEEEFLDTLDNSHSEIMENLESHEQSLQENVKSVSEICKEAAEVIEPEKVLKLLASYSGIKKRLNDSLIEPAQDLKVIVKELPVFEASANISLGSLSLGDDDEIDGQDLVKTPKVQTPKEVKFSIPEEVNGTNKEETDVTDATPVQPVVYNMSAIKNDSGFLSQVSEISQNGDASESDDEVFVDTSPEENHTGDEKLVSTYDMQITGGRSVTTTLKWENQEVNDCKAVAFYPDGSLVVVEYQNSGNRIKIYDCNGFPKRVTSHVSECVIKPWAVAVSPQSCQLVVSDHGDSTVKILDQNLSVKQTLKRMFNKPCGVAVMKTGEYVVTDGGSRVTKVSIHLSSGMRIRDFANKGSQNGCLLSPNFVTVDHNDRIIISDCDNHSIRIFDRLGKRITEFTWKNPNGQLMQPQGVCVTGRNNIVVADQAYHGLLLFSPDGRLISTLVKTDSLPWGVSVHDSGLVAVATDQGIYVYTVS